MLIARALAGDPRLLVMDEPTASLEFGNQARVLSQVRKLSSSGIAVVFSTHDPATRSSAEIAWRPCATARSPLSVRLRRP